MNDIIDILQYKLLKLAMGDLKKGRWEYWKNSVVKKWITRKKRKNWTYEKEYSLSYAETECTVIYRLY